MKKNYIFFTVAIVVAIGLMSSILADQGLSVGEKINNEKLLGNGDSKAVLVNFWATYDAASREENVRFSQVLKKYKGDEIGLRSVSVSLDDYDNLYQEIVKKDDLNFTTVIRQDNGFDSQMAKDFKLHHHFDNFLLSKDGKILAKNISPEELAEKLEKEQENQ